MSNYNGNVVAIALADEKLKPHIEALEKDFVVHLFSRWKPWMRYYLQQLEDFKGQTGRALDATQRTRQALSKARLICPKFAQQEREILEKFETPFPWANPEDPSRN